MNTMNRGIFTIPTDFIRDDPDQIAEILAEVRFLPLKVETFLMYEYVQYEGLSPLFPQVEKGAETPLYNIIMKSGPQGEIVKISFEVKDA